MPQAGRANVSALTVLALGTLAVANLVRGAVRLSAPEARRVGPSPDDATVRHRDHLQAAGTTGPGGVAAVPVDHPSGLIGIGRSIIDRFNRDNATLTAAGIAFYMFSSIFPGLAALVSIYGMFGNPEDVSREIAPFSGLLPPEAMKLLSDGLAGFVKNRAQTHFSIALVTSLAVALWSARAAMSSIITGLNIAYEETERRSFVVTTLVSIVLTLGAICFSVVAVVGIAVIPAVIAFVHLPVTIQALLAYGRWPILALLVVFAFAVLYRFAPNRSHPRWRWITWGSAIATVLWLGGSVLFSFYVSHFGSYDATYGSLGAVVVLLLWFWVSALVLILGAAIDSELDLRATSTGSPTAGTPPSAGPPKD